MAHVEVPGTMRINLTFTHATELQRCEMTFALTDLSGAIFNSFPGTASAFYGAAVNTLVHAASPQVVFDGVVIEDIRSLPYGGLDFPQTPTPGDGAFGGPPLPMSVSLAVKRVTGRLGRSGRGRLYWPIWNENMLSGPDEVGTAVASLITAQLISFQSALASSLPTAQMTVVSTEANGVPRTIGITNPIVDWVATDLVVDSQRRRLPGRGR